MQHSPTQLWLRAATAAQQQSSDPDATALALAVDCYPSRTQGAKNDNKLVLGLGNRRVSHLLARLTDAAYAAGNHVVAFTYEGLGPVASIGERVGATGYTITEPEQVCFNPFWFPDLPAKELPTEFQLRALSELLASVLVLTTAGEEQVGRALRPQLAQAVRAYYAHGTGPEPSFNSFYEFITRPEPNQSQAQQWFQHWLGKAGAPFYATGPIGQLLNGTPTQVLALVASPNRFLRVTLQLHFSSAFRTSVDTGDIQDSPPTDAMQRVLMLLLHSFDKHLTGESRLTIVLDDLHLGSVGPGICEYLTPYLADWQQFNRDLIVGWDAVPDNLISKQWAGPELVVRSCDTQLLTANPASGHYGSLKGYEALAMSEAAKALFLSMHHTRQEVLVRLPATGAGTIYNAEPTEKEVLSYLTAAEKALRGRGGK